MNGRCGLAATACVVISATWLGGGCSSEEESNPPPTTTPIPDAGGPDAVPPDSVELIRNAQGTPHVFAGSLADAMYGLGWATAEDRLFQIELKRRVMRGRMAEALGAGGGNQWIDLDRQQRIVGWARHADELAKHLPSEETALIQAYAAGVNAFVGHPGFTLPGDFALAHVEAFEPWTVADTLLAWTFIEAVFGGIDLKKALTVETKPPSDPGCAPVIDEEAATVKSDPLASFFPVPQPGRPLTFKASHSWVIAGSRNASSTGAVLNANPQLPVLAPSVLYEYQLSVPGLDVRGAGFPGAPGFLVFWNGKLAMGGSSAGGDGLDLFRLTLAPDGKSYVVDGTPEPFVETPETIHVRNGSDVSLVARQSRFGPVVSELIPSATDQYALRHVELAQTSSHSVIGALRMFQAKSPGEYRTAIADWFGPCIHTIFADHEGNIGYQPACGVPRRPDDGSPKSGDTPYDGSIGANDWNGFHPPSEMPSLDNPPEGYIFSANHLAVASWPFKVALGHGGDGDRSQRLRKIFGTLLPDISSKITPEDVAAIQNDAGSEPVRVFALALAHLRQLGELESAPGAPTTPKQKAWKLAALLMSWGEDQGTSPTQAYPGPQMLIADPRYPLLENLASVAPTHFRALEYPTLSCAWGNAAAGLAHWQKAFEADPGALLSDFTDPVQAEARDYHIAVAASAWDAENLGSLPADPASWPLASAQHFVPHQMNFLCMGQAGCQIDSCVLEDPAPCSLHPAADLSALLWGPSSHTLRSQIGNSYSYWVALGNADAARSILPPGVSEDWTKPSYASSLDAWSTGDTFAAPMSHDAVKAQASSVTTLEHE